MAEYTGYIKLVVGIRESWNTQPQNPGRRRPEELMIETEEVQHRQAVSQPEVGGLGVKGRPGVWLSGPT
jgi:hypothetical protein